MEKLKLVLKRLGYTDDQIKVLTDEAQDFDPAELAQASKDVLKESLRNDEEFVSDIEQKMRGKVLSSKENKVLKLFGIDREEYDALPDRNKFDALLELAATRAKEANGGQGDEALKKEVEKLRAKVQDKDNALNELKQTLETTKGQVDVERARFGIEREVVRHLGAKDLVLEVEDATALTLQHLEREFDVKATDGKVQLFKKGTELKATNPETEREITFAEALDGIVEKRKWVKKNNGDEGHEGGNLRVRKDGKQVADGPAPPKKPLPGLEAARQAAARRTAKTE